VGVKNTEAKHIGLRPSRYRWAALNKTLITVTIRKKSAVSRLIGVLLQWKRYMHAESLCVLQWLQSTIHNAINWRYGWYGVTAFEKYRPDFSSLQ